MYWVIAIGITVIIWVLLLDFPATEDQQQQAFFASSNHIKSKKLTSALNKKRKLFHGLAVVMFIPGVLFAVSTHGWDRKAKSSPYLCRCITELIPSTCFWSCPLCIHLSRIPPVLCRMAVRQESAHVFDRIHRQS